MVHYMSATAIEDGLKVAVLLPCHNQAGTIGGLVRGFAEALPGAMIYVFDNNSTDDTAREATRAGAQVRREARPGKGSVVRRMFADIDADIYVLADPAARYDPADAPSLVNALITERVDMVIGTRADDRGGAFGVSGENGSFGMRAFDWCYRRFFGSASSDIGSGYRAFTRRFVKSFPAISTGFDVEIELSIHASQLMIPVAEIRLESGQALSEKKRAPADGIRTFAMLAALLRDARPFVFYSAFAVCFWIIGLIVIVPHALSYTESGPQQPISSVLFAMVMLLAGFILAGSGLILDALGRSRIEQKRILFLTVPALGGQ
jgi:glycosyltransferase involved in cell wall biosynthesis